VPSTVTVYRYARSHTTHAETSVTRRLNQRMGEPCNGGSAIVLPDSAPRPSAAQPRTCDTCLGLVEMDLVDEMTMTLSG
jgi:hypothetical protein